MNEYCPGCDGPAKRGERDPLTGDRPLECDAYVPCGYTSDKKAVYVVDAQCADGYTDGGERVNVENPHLPDYVVVIPETAPLAPNGQRWWDAKQSWTREVLGLPPKGARLARKLGVKHVIELEERL